MLFVAISENILWWARRWWGSWL